MASLPLCVRAHAHLVRASVIRVLLALVAPLAGCVGDIGNAGSGMVPDGDDIDRRQEFVLPDCPGGQPRPLARGLRIREIALYQTVKIPLFRDGKWLDKRAAPIVRGKQALLRVFVDPLAGYAPHEVTAVLRLNADGKRRELGAAETIVAASKDAALGSTFDIDIPKELMGAALELSVSLEEPSCDGASGTPEDARAPASGAKGIEVESIGKLQIALVPIVADGRAPMVTDASVAGMRAALHAMYPVPDVEISVHAPVPFRMTGNLATDDEAWGPLTALLRALRKREAPPNEVYYVGVFQPDVSRAAYCARGSICILGMAPRASVHNAGDRVANAVFFADDKGYETVTHELGHSHGLTHVGCLHTEKDVDENYPDPDGDVIDWGWDERTRKLLPPTMKDVMSYCGPTWISAYNYRALAERAQQINVLAFKDPRAIGAFRDLYVSPRGSARWASDTPVDDLAGTRETARVRDAAGQEIAQIELGVVPMSHAESVYVYLPAPGPRWSSIVWSRGTITLSDVLPPY